MKLISYILMESHLVVNRYFDFSSVFPKCNKDILFLFVFFYSGNPDFLGVNEVCME